MPLPPVQFSEFTLYDLEGDVISIASGSSTCSSHPSDEAPEDALDGSTGSKFLCFNHPTDLVATFASTSLLLNAPSPCRAELQLGLGLGLG